MKSNKRSGKRGILIEETKKFARTTLCLARIEKRSMKRFVFVRKLEKVFRIVLQRPG